MYAAGETAEDAGDSQGETAQAAFLYHNSPSPTTCRFQAQFHRTGENGEVLRMKDIADIELGRLSYNFNNTVNGHKAVSCIVSVSYTHLSFLQVSFTH